jgi:hypothetical protein
MESGNFNREAWRARREAQGGGGDEGTRRRPEGAGGNSNSEGSQRAEGGQGNREGPQRRAEGGQGAGSGEGQRARGEGGQGGGGQRQRGEGGGQGRQFTGGGGFGGGGGRGRQFMTVWVLTAAKTIEPRLVRIGITNGRVTEIIAGDLQEGDTVIIGQNETGASRPQTQTGPPFGQQPRPGGGGRGPGR